MGRSAYGSRFKFHKKQGSTGESINRTDGQILLLGQCCTWLLICNCHLSVCLILKRTGPVAEKNLSKMSDNYTMILGQHVKIILMITVMSFMPERLNFLWLP